ncbi:mechanosensitive ion channel family protein [Fulvivirga sp. M361]|uniref:mechanosensitive ion channel family protein n=1 Tax=Fulvivirga sp. M361 TaxID=2594266 RepID=UPI00117B36EB|nr:mechanosensitive ion channel family protein [Fulvivirga sp. M361]TRX60524.1 mechanosensitive ion channel family protein [Fulvivirga sp. M361]
MLNDLNEAFVQFWESVIAQTPSITIGVLLLVTFIFLGSLLRSVTKRRLLKNISDQLLINFIGRIVFLIMLVIGIVVFLNQVGLGKTAGGLLAGAGVSALILGFAFKDIGENFLAGFFLAFSRPFGIGDVVEVEGLKGVVKALSFRNTHIRTFDGKDIFIPNSMLIKNPLINYTRDGLLRHDFVVGIDYGDDVTQAGAVIMEALEEEQRIEHKGELSPFIQLDEFSTSTINIRIFYWVNSYDFTGSIALLKTAVMNNVVTKLIKNNFSLPADIVEFKMYQEGQPIPLTLSSDPSKTKP